MGSIWTPKEARESLDSVVKAAQDGEPQRLAPESGESVVLVSESAYELMARRPKTFVEHLLSAPKLPDGFDDIFDERDRYASTLRDVDLG